MGPRTVQQLPPLGTRPFPQTFAVWFVYLKLEKAKEAVGILELRRLISGDSGNRYERIPRASAFIGHWHNTRLN